MISMRETARSTGRIRCEAEGPLGRKWQCATIQLDFALPERFDLHYTDKDSQRKRRFMLHRVILGAMERFIGILIRALCGPLPAVALPCKVLHPHHHGRASRLCGRAAADARDADIRVEVDGRNEKLGFKIREGTMRKVPYMLILGRKEAETRTISSGAATGAEMKGVSAAEFIERAREENTSRR